MIRCVALLVALSAALAIAAVPAFAQTSGSAYSTPAGEVQADVSSGPAPRSNNSTPAQATETTSGSQLPFTGLDVGLLVGAGVALLLVGGALSRLTRSTAGDTE